MRMVTGTLLLLRIQSCDRRSSYHSGQHPASGNCWLSTVLIAQLLWSPLFLMKPPVKLYFPVLPFLTRNTDRTARQSQGSLLPCTRPDEESILPLVMALRPAVLQSPRPLISKHRRQREVGYFLLFLPVWLPFPQPPPACPFLPRQNGERTVSSPRTLTSGVWPSVGGLSHCLPFNEPLAAFLSRPVEKSLCDLDIIWKFEGEDGNLDLTVCQGPASARHSALSSPRRSLVVYSSYCWGSWGERCLHPRPSENLNRNSPDSETYVLFIMWHSGKEPGAIFLWRQCWSARDDGTCILSMWNFSCRSLPETIHQIFPLPFLIS